MIVFIHFIVSYVNRSWLSTICCTGSAQPIGIIPVPIELHEGQTLNLICESNYTVEWRRRGSYAAIKPVYDERKNYSKANVTVDDTDGYTCNNGVTGEAIAIYNVTVKG